MPIDTIEKHSRSERGLNSKKRRDDRKRAEPVLEELNGGRGIGLNYCTIKDLTVKLVLY
jgi:hypothetical protein